MSVALPVSNCLIKLTITTALLDRPLIITVNNSLAIRRIPNGFAVLMMFMRPDVITKLVDEMWRRYEKWGLNKGEGYVDINIKEGDGKWDVEFTKIKIRREPMSPPKPKRRGRRRGIKVPQKSTIGKD